MFQGVLEQIRFHVFLFVTVAVIKLNNYLYSMLASVPFVH
jgi:hypothetical protein